MNRKSILKKKIISRIITMHFIFYFTSFPIYLYNFTTKVSKKNVPNLIPLKKEIKMLLKKDTEKQTFERQQNSSGG